MLSDGKEARKGEMFIPDIDEKTLSILIKYVYTDQLEMAEDQDLQMMIHAADKYQLSSLITLVCKQMRKVDLKGDRIADLLISAHVHWKEELRQLALEKIRANRKICQEKGFKEKMEMAPSSIMIDLFNDF